MYIRKNFIIIMINAFIVIASYRGINSHTIESYPYLKPHIYEIQNEEFSQEDNIQMGKQYEGLRVWGGNRTFLYYKKPVIMKNLDDYLNNNHDFMSLFYDTRTLSLNEKELTELCRSVNINAYVDFIERNFVDGLNVRIYNILFDPLDPTKSPIKIIQTWNENEIFCQSVSTPLPRRFADAMSIEKNYENNKLVIWCYNTGLEFQDLSTELQFWEFKDSRWTPCELDTEIELGFELEEYYVGEIKRSSFNSTTYPDGIAFYNSILGDNQYKFVEFEIFEGNKIRVSSNEYPEYFADIKISY